MEIAEKDGGFCTSDGKNDVHQQQKPKHVVRLVGPGDIQTNAKKVLAKI